jgi:hypothetical protein
MKGERGVHHHPNDEQKQKQSHPRARNKKIEKRNNMCQYRMGECAMDQTPMS